MLLQNLHCFRVGHPAKVGAGHVLEALQQALVHKGVKEIHLLGAALQDGADHILNHVLGHVHVSGQVTEGHLRSIIQNSAAWRWVLEFSARKVGPKVYTLPKAMAKFSQLSWPETVRLARLPKKSWV